MGDAQMANAQSFSYSFGGGTKTGASANSKSGQIDFSQLFGMENMGYNAGVKTGGYSGGGGSGYGPIKTGGYSPSKNTQLSYSQGKAVHQGLYGENSIR